MWTKKEEEPYKGQLRIKTTIYYWTRKWFDNLRKEKTTYQQFNGTDWEDLDEKYEYVHI